MQIRRPFTVTLAALSLGTLGAPAPGSASNGGATPDVITLPGPTPIVVRIGNPIARASAGGIAIAVRTTAMAQSTVHVTGSVRLRPRGAVRIERFDAQLGWVAVATPTVKPDGSFSVRWHPDRVGAIELRATIGSGSAAGAAGEAGASATPEVAVNVYRRGLASWYGPLGATTACGVLIAHDTLGVAHRSLPCGTPVALYYHGRTLVVPVIDRGPYVHGRTWDLTRATYRALGGRGEGLLLLGALAQPATPARHR